MIRTYNVKDIGDMRDVRNQGYTWVIAMRQNGPVPKDTVISRHRSLNAACSASDRLDERYIIYEVDRLLIPMVKWRNEK